MSVGGSSAVFFLGTRAHYQVLQTPDTISYDIENGNTSTESIYRNISTDNLNSPISGEIDAGNIVRNEWAKEYSSELTLIDCEISGSFEFSTGTRRRRRENSNQYILSEEQHFIDIDAAELNMCDRGSPKCKDQSRRCINLRALLSNLKVRRKRKLPQNMEYSQNSLSMCTYKDSCRCLECQSRYFECDEDVYSETESERSITPPLPTAMLPQQPEYEDSTDENDEVFIDDPPAVPSVPIVQANVASVPSVGEEDDDEMQVHMAAGTPVVLDYLLHHPLTCNIQ